MSNRLHVEVFADDRQCAIVALKKAIEKLRALSPAREDDYISLSAEADFRIVFDWVGPELET